MASVNDLQLNTTITLQDNFSSRMGGFVSSIGRVHGMLENLNKTMNNITRTISAPMGNVFSNSLTRIGRSTHRANIELNMLNNTLRRTVGLTSRIPTGGILNRVGTVGSTGGGDTPSLNPSSVFSGFGDLLKNNIVTALVGAFGSVAVLKQTQKLFEDATKQMTVHQRLSHLDFVAKGETNINDLKDSIFGASMRSKTDYLAFADMVANIGSTANEAFGSSGELIQFTEQLQKIFTQDNMGASERASATVQLSRALANGQFEGRQLNSILSPTLINLIAKTLEKPRTEIKKLASEGKIGADIVKKAIFDNVDEINKKFLDMPDGWGEVMIRINNYAQHAFQGVYQKITDIFTAERIQKIGEKIAPIFYNLASIIEKVIDKTIPAIDWVIDNFDSLFNGISSLTILAGSIIGIITTINVLMATCPVGIIAGILVLLEVGIQYLNKINGTTYNLFSFISAGLVFIWESVMDFFKFVSMGLVFSIGMISRGILYIGNLIIKLGKGTIAIFRLSWVSIKWIFSSGINYLFQSINWLCEKITQGLTLVVKNFLDPLITGLNMLINLSNKIADTKFDKIELSLSPEKNGIVKFFSNNQKNLQYGIDKNNGILGNEASKIIGGVFKDYEFEKADNTIKQLTKDMVLNIGDSIKESPLEKAGKTLKNTSNLWNFNQSKTNQKMLKWDNVSTGFDKSKVLNDIKSNTDDIKNHTDFSKYLRELADRNTINHFTTPTYNIKLESQNTINSQSDVNGFVERVADEIKEALTNSIQGDYNSYGGAFA